MSIGKPMKRYAVREEREVPAVCPLINTCEQYRADKEEYASLCRKWTDYAKRQEPEENLVVTGMKGREEEMTMDWASPVSGSQVFYLEYTPKKGMKPAERRKLLEDMRERFSRMCPHFKRDVLGMPTSDPPYQDCRLFSEWFYRREH